MLWIRIKYKLQLIFKTLLFKLGLSKLFLRNRYGERVLVFHGIDKIGETRFNSRFVSEAFFEEFIIYSSKHYNIISLDDFYAKKFKKNTLNIAITFDDGYENNYKYAVPILKKHNIPATFYITTIHEKAPYLWADFIDLVSFHTKKTTVTFDGNNYQKNNKNEFIYNGVSLKSVSKTIPYQKIKSLYNLFQDDWKNLLNQELEDYWKLMPISQIQEIANDPLFTIGSHAETHANLIRIPIADAKNEILKSKETLSTICNQPIEEFAFPFGTYTKELADYCLEIGYKKVLLVDYNTKEDAQNDAFKNRFVMNPYITLKLQLAYLLKGKYY